MSGQTKKAVEIHRLFCVLTSSLLVCSDSRGHQNQQDQGEQDALRGATCLFNNYGCFNNRLFQRAGRSGRSSSSQCSGENEFLHINLQNSHGSIH